MRICSPSDEMARLPAQPITALKFLELLGQEETSAADLGEVVQMDPVLAARVMRLAYSPLYGGHRRTASASRAVVTLGISAVRATAASAVAGLLAQDVPLGPPGFWAHSVATAHAAAAAASLTGAPTAEAFSVGLLHDIGTAVLQQRDRERYDALVTTASRGGLSRLERVQFGTDHAEVGAQALAGWGFPDEFLAAVADHHGSVGDQPPLTRALILGHAVAQKLEPVMPSEGGHDLAELLRTLGKPTSAGAELIRSTEISLRRVHDRIVA